MVVRTINDILRYSVEIISDGHSGNGVLFVPCGPDVSGYIYIFTEKQFVYNKNLSLRYRIDGSDVRRYHYEGKESEDVDWMVQTGWNSLAVLRIPIDAFHEEGKPDPDYPELYLWPADLELGQTHLYAAGYQHIERTGNVLMADCSVHTETEYHLFSFDGLSQEYIGSGFFAWKDGYGLGYVCTGVNWNGVDEIRAVSPVTLLETMKDEGWEIPPTLKEIKEDHHFPIEIIQGDITNVFAEAVVDATNTSCNVTKGISQVIYTAAGGQEAMIDWPKSCNLGQAVVTDGYRLNARYIIHTVGPTWRDYESSTSGELLGITYKNVLHCAKEYGIHSVAFPLISSGGKHFPLDVAWNVAFDACLTFLSENPDYPLHITIVEKKAEKIEKGLEILSEHTRIGRQQRQELDEIYMYNMVRIEYQDTILSGIMLPNKGEATLSIVTSGYVFGDIDLSKLRFQRVIEGRVQQLEPENLRAVYLGSDISIFQCDYIEDVQPVYMIEPSPGDRAELYGFPENLGSNAQNYLGYQVDAEVAAMEGAEEGRVYVSYEDPQEVLSLLSGDDLKGYGGAALMVIKDGKVGLAGLIWRSLNHYSNRHMAVGCTSDRIRKYGIETATAEDFVEIAKKVEEDVNHLHLAVEEELKSVAHQRILEEYPQLEEAKDLRVRGALYSYRKKGDEAGGAYAYLTIEEKDLMEWRFHLNGPQLSWMMEVTSEIEDKGESTWHIAIYKDRMIQRNIELCCAFEEQEIIGKLRAAAGITQYDNAQVVGLWYEAQFCDRIPSRKLIFTSDIDIEVKENVIRFVAKKDAGDSSSLFRISDDSEMARINNISAIVGKNGTGKTTAFRMLGLDAPGKIADTSLGNYVVFYKMNQTYYFSTNFRDNRYEIRGIRPEYEISEKKARNSNVVFYSAALSLNTESQLNGINGVDISNGYVFEKEYQKSGPEKFYEIGRKLQLLADYGYQRFEEKMSFVPDTIKFTVPEDIIYKLDGESQNLLVDENGRSIEIREESLENIWKIYIGLMEYLAQAEEQAEKDCDRVTMTIPGLSSGQYALFDFYSRLHSFFLSQAGVKERAKWNCFDTKNHCRNYILLLDEIELFMHPKWQKEFIYRLIEFLEWEIEQDKDHQVIDNIQIMLSSNSPFFMSDLPRENVCMLYTKEEPVQSNTFAQNIHTILSRSFFMGDGVMGEFAKYKINKAYADLERWNELTEKQQSEIGYLCGIIGEPLIRNSLTKRYEAVCEKEQDQEEEMLLKNLEGRISAELLEQVKKEMEQKE